MAESELVSDPQSRAIDAQVINPNQVLALVDHSDQCIGLQSPMSFHPRLTWLQASEPIMLAVEIDYQE